MYIRSMNLILSCNDLLCFMLQVDTMTHVKYEALITEIEKEHSRKNRNEEHLAELMKVHICI